MIYLFICIMNTEKDAVTSLMRNYMLLCGEVVKDVRTNVYFPYHSF